MIEVIPFRGNKLTLLKLYPKSDSDSLTEISDYEADENGEACVQLVEGCTYYYEVNEGYHLDTKNVVVEKLPKKPKVWVNLTREFHWYVRIGFLS